MENKDRIDETKAPKNCPGIDSEKAGNTEACQGCPNQLICQSAEIKLEKEKLLNLVKDKFKNVKNIYLVMSGKGGVGKSTVASLIARTIAFYNYGEVGYLDIDLCGPSTSRIFGISGEIHRSNFGLSPLVTKDGISVMSTDFLLNSKKEALIWRGPKKNSLIKELVLNVNWDDIDYLIVDTPPGTSDEHLSMVELFKLCEKTSAIVIYTPEEVALSDVRKQINFLRSAGIPLMGTIENLSTFICPKCHNESQLYPRSQNELNIFTGSSPLCFIPMNLQIRYCEAKGINPYEYINEENNPVFNSLKILMKKMGFISNT